MNVIPPSTAIDNISSGKLQGYRIPGSGDRRIPLAQLVAFMRLHEMPMEGLCAGMCRVLVVDHHPPRGLVEAMAETGHYDVRIASTEFEAGVLAGTFHPQVFVLDLSVGDEEAAEVCRNIKSHEPFRGAHVLATGSCLTSVRCEWLLNQGFDVCLEKPWSPSELLGAIEEATDLSG